jgi:hypothetical protein
VAHNRTTSSLHATFKFLELLGRTMTNNTAEKFVTQFDGDVYIEN